ncbi:hypothetical protein [Acinetobacter sp. BSP-28]|uniref:hypothetical protein n=1 Tax=Acinetobacter sp. BSP-28 TaxID=3344661 RepID=UPI00377044DA
MTQAATTTASIPMGVEVPKSCSFSNVSSGLVLPEDGSEVQGSFTFSCNMDGGFDLSTFLDSVNNTGHATVVNSEGIHLPITATLTGNGYGSRSLNNASSAPFVLYVSGWLNSNIQSTIKAKLVTPTTATTPAGVYTDTFRVNVNY